MQKITLNLTEDMLKLISCISFGEYPYTEEKPELDKEKELTKKGLINKLLKFNTQKKEAEKQRIYAIDVNHPYGGGFVLEDIAYILGGYEEHVVPGTECDAIGPAFDREYTDYMVEIHEYIMDNLQHIESLVHQYITKGGVTQGTYTFKDYEGVWKKKEK